MPLVAHIDNKRNLVAIFLAWKILTLILLATVLQDLTSGWPVGYSQNPDPLKSFENWDGEWYLRIAREGYIREGSRAFFPLFPYLIRVVSFGIFDEVICGLILNIAFSAAFTVFYYKVGKALFPSRTAAVALVLFLTIPGAFYLTTIYTEALFLFMLFFFLWLFLIKQSYWAAIPAVLLIFTRGQGFFVALAVGCIFLIEAPGLLKRREYIRLKYITAVTLSFVAGTGFFFLFQYLQFGDPLQFIRIQQSHHFSEHFDNSIFNALSVSHVAKVLFQVPATIFGTQHSLFDKFFIYASILLLPFVWRISRTLFPFYLTLFYFPAFMGQGGSFGRFFILPYSIAAFAVAHFFTTPGRITSGLKEILLGAILIAGMAAESTLCLFFAAYWWIA